MGAPSPSRPQLVVAFVLAALPGLVAARMPSPPAPARATLCAGTSLPAGAWLDEPRFLQCAWPAAWLDHDAVAPTRAHRQLAHHLAAGRPVREADLAPAPLLTPRGLRAITLELGFADAGGDHLEVGDLVDVLQVLTTPWDQQHVANHLVQRVQVGRRVVLDSGRVEVAVFAIVEEAEVLAEAQKLGRLVLSLRNPDDNQMLEEPQLTKESALFEGQRAWKMRSLSWSDVHPPHGR